MNRLLVAIAFLTRLPVPWSGALDARAVGRASLLFPAVGLLLGGAQAAALHVMAARLPATLAAVLAVALAAALTGALHLDGLADTADGFGGGRDREHALAIMRDHAVGAFGATALVLVLAVKAAAIVALASTGAWRWILLAPALARWVPVALARALPYARAGDGLGRTVTDGAGAFELAGATLLAVGAAVGLAGVRGVLALGAVAGFTLGHGLACRRRIGGVTGDTMGAAVELAEALALVAGVALG
ncbi:MAG TPA: adenosylcobinamide-GDP ribazoletransferase [Anaeromyxobacter sp.]